MAPASMLGGESGFADAKAPQVVLTVHDAATGQTFLAERVVCRTTAQASGRMCASPVPAGNRTTST